MPRQDVPYGGAICRLKERIAEIWDKLDQKLHSINGVEGDGAGNVEIVSGNDAVVINNDQIGHRIEVSLDSSKLPAAAVSSVNGQTGAVRLDAADVPSDGNSNVQADIAANKAAINECFDGITSEQTARQNADATLQTNINAVQASLDGRMTATESKNNQQDTAITALQTADEQNVKINKINQYAVGLTGNQPDIAGAKIFLGECTGTGYFGLTNKRAPFAINDRSANNRSWFRILEDINSKSLISGIYDINEDGSNQVALSMNIDVSGTTETIELVRVVTDASGNVTIASIGGRSIT